MEQNIVVKISADVEDVESAIKALERLGVVDEKLRKEFEDTNRSLKDRRVEVEQLSSKQTDLTSKIDLFRRSLDSVGVKVAEGSVKKFSEQLDSAAQATVTAKSKVSELTKEIRGVIDAAVRGKLSGKELANAMAEVAAKRAEIKDLKNEIASLDPDKVAQSFLRLGQSIAGAFTVATGVMGLVGEKNKDLQNSILKVQSALAVLQGLSALQNLTDELSIARKILLTRTTGLYSTAVDVLSGKLKVLTLIQQGFNRVVSANPIALLLSVVGALTAGIVALTKATSNAVKEQESLGLKVSLLANYKQKVNEQLAAEKANIEVLLTIAKNHSLSYETRKKALEDLVKLSPKYLEGLTLENLETKKGVEILSKYNKALTLTIEIEAARQILVEETKKRLMALTDIEANKPSFWQTLKNAVLSFGSAAQFSLKQFETYSTNQTKAVKESTENIQNLLTYISKLSKELDDLGGSVTAPVTAISKAVTATKELHEEMRKLPVKEQQLDRYMEKVLKLITNMQMRPWRRKEIIDAAYELAEELLKALYDPFIDLHEEEAIKQSLRLLTKFIADNTKEEQLQVREIRLRSFEEMMQLIRQRNLDNMKRIVSDTKKLWQDGYEFLSNISTIATNVELANLQKQLQMRKITQEQYEAQEKRIRREAAIREKQMRIFETIINTASAIVEALPDARLAAIVGAIGASQLGVIVSQPIPAFSKGTLRVPGVDTGKDTVLALLRPSEAVIPVEQTKDYRPVLEAVFNRTIPPLIFNSLTLSAIDTLKAPITSTSSTLDTGIVDKLGNRLERAIQNLTINEFHFDHNGFWVAVKKGLSESKLISSRYTW